MGAAIKPRCSWSTSEGGYKDRARPDVNVANQEPWTNFSSASRPAI